MYYQSKGWFFSCDNNCQVLKAREASTRQHFDEINAAYVAEARDVRSRVGVFSTHAVAAARTNFDEKYQAGKEFSKRQTMWDAFWMALGSRGRDENMAEFVLRLVINFILNFSVGLFMAVCAFLWGVSATINAFGASLTSPTGMLAFLVAATASISFALSFCVGGYAAVTATVFAVETVNQGRLTNGSQDRRYRVRNE